jgi:putative nucleotidyltransferase with HDIG domain
VATEAVETETELFPIPLAIMQPGTVAPVNIYIQVGDPPTFSLYKTAQTPLSEEVRDRLLQRDVSQLYVRREDEDEYLNYVEQNIDAIIRDDLLPPDKACQIVYRGSSRVMVDVFDNPRSGRNLRRVQTMVEATVLSIMKHDEALWQMTSMASHDYYTYTHCVNVGVFLVAASKDLLGIDEEPSLQRIGLGGMLHDIGKSQIPEEILNKPGKLDDDEFEKIKEHPVIGLELVNKLRKLPGVAGAIVRGHHEHFDGTGYPDGLAGDRINRVVRLSTIIDVYDALTTRRAYADARKPFEALELMLTQMPEQFDKPLLKAFVKFLGPREVWAGS